MPLTPLLAFLSLLLIALGGSLFGVGAGLVIGKLQGARGGTLALIVGGVAAAGAVLGVFGGIVQYSHVRKAEAEARRGWNLVPVVVAAADIKRGETLTFDMISQRSIPEQFIAPGIVKPYEAVYAVNQRVAADLLAGDPLFWHALCVKAPR